MACTAFMSRLQNSIQILLGGLYFLISVAVVVCALLSYANTKTCNTTSIRRLHWGNMCQIGSKWIIQKSVFIEYQTLLCNLCPRRKQEIAARSALIKTTSLVIVHPRIFLDSSNLHPTNRLHDYLSEHWVCILSFSSTDLYQKRRAVRNIRVHARFLSFDLLI